MGVATHGKSDSPVYRSWEKMRQRCNNKKSTQYSYYGGRGIRVCERWETFDTFYEDMGERPSKHHSLDRIDNSKGYSPENCRWATKREQALNRRSNIRLTFKGEALTVSQWAKKTGLSRATIEWRFHAGWTTERTLTQEPDMQRRE